MQSNHAPWSKTQSEFGDTGESQQPPAAATHQRLNEPCSVYRDRARAVLPRPPPRFPSKQTGQPVSAAPSLHTERCNGCQRAAHALDHHQHHHPSLSHGTWCAVQAPQSCYHAACKDTVVAAGGTVCGPSPLPPFGPRPPPPPPPPCWVPVGQEVAVVVGFQRLPATDRVETRASFVRGPQPLAGLLSSRLGSQTIATGSQGLRPPLQDATHDDHVICRPTSTSLRTEKQSACADR
jgi:hypothetical protein